MADQKMKSVYSEVKKLREENDLKNFWPPLKTYNQIIEQSVLSEQRTNFSLVTRNLYDSNWNTSIWTNELRSYALDLWLNLEQTKDSANFYSPLLIVMNASEAILKTELQSVLEPQLRELVSEWKGSIALTNSVSKLENVDLGKQPSTTSDLAESDPDVSVTMFEVTQFDQDLVTDAIQTMSVSDDTPSAEVTHRNVKFVITVRRVFV
jgi:hypothetical protein